MATTYPNFPSSWNVLTSSILVKDFFFPGCGILDWWWFCVSAWKLLCHPLLDPCFLMRNLPLFKLFFPCVSYVSFLLLLSRFFSLFLVFKSLPVLCVGVTFFRFVLFVICLTSEPLGLCQIWWVFIMISFQPHPSSLLPELWWHKC